MGGRGAGAGGSGGGANGELVLPDGSKIEFEGTLHYDGDDKALTGATRTAITNWETKRATAKVEYAYAVDVNGKAIGSEVRGGRSSVRTPISYHSTQDCTFTHIHPRGDGMLGGTFSSADLRNFANYGNKTARAAAKEGTYSISKGKGFDRVGFNKFVATAQRAFESTYKQKRSSYESAYRQGKISYEDYAKGNAKAFNSQFFL